MLSQIKRYVGGFLIALSLATLLGAAVFCWAWRDGLHAQTASSGVIAPHRFGQQFWPVPLCCLPVFLVGLACAGPPRQWFSPRATSHKRRTGAV